MSSSVSKYSRIFCLLFLTLGLSGAVTWCWAEEALPIRLVGVIDLDDQGERIGFPIALYYDYWASETYLVSSTGRITIYDQKFFPIASFGKGRGVSNPTAVAVDRRGNIYVCQEKLGTSTPNLVIYNQAFFPTKEIDFLNTPELVDFRPTKVAVAEGGEIYLAGNMGINNFGGVVVLTPEGKFARILRPPENNAWRPFVKKEVAATDKGAKTQVAVVTDAPGAAESYAIPAGLRPKTASAKREDDEENGQLEPAYISDVKVDRQGRVYLLSRETSNIYVLNAKEEYLFKFGEKGGVNGKLSNPVSLAIDLERRTIYVCDYMRHTILCYDYDTGAYVFEFGGRGFNPLWFNFPNNVEVDQRGRVVVSDLFNRRIQVIDTNMEERRPLAVLLPSKMTLGPTAAVEEVLSPLQSPAPPELTSITPRGEEGLPQLLPAVVVVPAPVVQVYKLRELTPRLLKKSTRHPAPKLQLVSFSPVASPQRFVPPAGIRFASGKTVRPARHSNETSNIVLQTFKSLPAAVGVYGPVATSLGVGSRLLSTSR